MTETSSPAVLTPPGQILDRPGDAIGVAVPLDDVATDATGEILFRGATVIRGYDRNPEADALAYRNGWLRSGDLGSIGDDGFVTVSDRIKDIVNRGAEKISTLEVEDVLCAHPAVVEAAVVAAPDDLYGEVPHAFVVADGALDGRELRAFAGERLARFKVPSRVSFVEELPRNPGGKVLKNLLRERLSA
jgi:long-chain acyl-CoA synthetase